MLIYMCSDKLPQAVNNNCNLPDTRFVHAVKFDLKPTNEHISQMEDMLSGTFTLCIGDERIEVNGELLYGDYIKSLKEDAT